MVADYEALYIERMTRRNGAPLVSSLAGHGDHDQDPLHLAIGLSLGGSRREVLRGPEG